MSSPSLLLYHSSFYHSQPSLSYPAFYTRSNVKLLIPKGVAEAIEIFFRDIDILLWLSYEEYCKRNRR
jgi:hypothetical protein